MPRSDKPSRHKAAPNPNQSKDNKTGSAILARSFGRCGLPSLRLSSRPQKTPADLRQRNDHEKTSEGCDRMRGEMAVIPSQLVPTMSGMGESHRSRSK